jgi:SAM-dependent methyltransferase
MPELEPDIQLHYEQGAEERRLETWARLEGIRTRELLQRMLPWPPAAVLDVGGARGAYALALAAAGHVVHLLDPVPVHVEAALAGSAAQPEAPIASAVVGDARAVPFEDGCVEAVLLLGPLYHLTDAADRALALAEAHRVLAPGGVLLAASISRFASTYDGLAGGAMDDRAFEAMVEGDLRDGVHRNPDPAGRPEWFTLAYFHRPEELRAEVEAAGFTDVRLIAIEGPGAWLPGAAEMLDDPVRRDTLLRAIRRVESEPALLGASAHVMAVGRRGL